MRRSRKPVWAFPSIGGSNPPLSVDAGRFAAGTPQEATQRFPSRIKLRSSFAPELQKSVDNL